MFYNGCVLRYSDKYFFSMLNETPHIELISSDTITDPSPFLDTVSGLLDDLVTKAVNNTSISPSLFATGSTNYTSSDEVHSMVQCTPDLTPSVCNTCLRSALARLSSCCFDTQGARVLYPSCTFRFQIYTFYGDYMYTNNIITPASPPLLLPPPTLQSPSNSTNSNGNNSLIVLAVSIAVPLGIAVLLSSIAVWWFYFHRKKKINNNYSDMDQDSQSAQSLLFNFSIISAATNNFAEANKLGEGGFGPVYKGTLSDGQEIAVKRLAKSSGQGEREFKNEVTLLAKLQHRNLVRLLGFCLHGEEKLLIYELMSRSAHLRIIHRDLKTGNILLAEDMTPKISDFGMARLFQVDQTQANTMRIVGTYGYMAPEYALHGQFSVKSDVFSFGVLVLEIISGKKNTAFYEGGAQDLPTYAWQYWQKGLVMELLDSSLKENCSRSELMRCVHISLLCVQDNIADRPTMASIILVNA
ncbi:hypothetical protein C5167_009955 [Papaver somniferum]|uniref:Protein kinase domain-containing protein n=1 Tax=Papaver somniferum TaxID=3469 RepID=A0A4Y7JYU5_PAPSO|nr:hypothetical protein C5167_009955 [Papaver somniferum]